MLKNTQSFQQTKIETDFFCVIQNLTQCNEVGAPLTFWAFQGKQDMFTASLCVLLLELLQD